MSDQTLRAAALEWYRGLELHFIGLVDVLGRSHRETRLASCAADDFKDFLIFAGILDENGEIKP